MRDSIEIFALLKKHLAAVVIPVVAEVILDILFQRRVYIEAATMRLVLYTANQVEPLLQLLLIKALVLALD